MNRFICDADGYHVNVHLNTQLELPNNRDTVLHFFEQMKKAFPDLRSFYTRENGDLVLEGEKENESHRWVAIEMRRLCSGHFNPETLDEAFRQHELVLDLAPHLLTISLLDCEALDVMFGFDFQYEGNHDEVVAEAIGSRAWAGRVVRATAGQGDQFRALADARAGRVVPIAVPPGDRDAHKRLSVRAREPGDDQIRVYFTVRQYWGSGPEITFVESMRRQRELGEEIVQHTVIPRIVQPLAQAIASR